MSFQHKKIGEILQEMQAITAGQKQQILRHPSNGSRFGERGVLEGYFDEKALAAALAVQFSLPLLDMENFYLDKALFSSMPAGLPLRYSFLPVRQEGQTLIIAISDPTAVTTLDNLEAQLDLSLQLQITTPEFIAQQLEQGESGSKQVLSEVSDDLKLQLVKETDSGEEVLSIEKLSTDASPIIRLVDSTLYDALNKRASDIHIETGSEGVVIKYRVDGLLFRAMEPLAEKFQSAIISRIKVMSELDISEKRIPQDGRFKVRLNNRVIDFRVSIMPSIYGEDAVIRILDKESIASDLKGLTLDTLGIAGPELKSIRRLIREPFGMVLVTGPTGSGKTTTLYGALSEILNDSEKIITIEDPVEYQLKGVLQIPVNEKKGLTFARGLRSILRHDPDKIMVGEIRDSETAQIAVQSALTGHLVFTTVHANNVFDVINRFIHMGIDPYNFVSSLNCVIAQRLIRTICPHCKKAVKYDRQTLEEAGLNPDQCRDGHFYVGEGCVKCNGVGYLGRSAIVELLELDDDLRDLISRKTPTKKLKQYALAAGTRFLRQSAIDKLLAGETTLEEINRVTFNRRVDTEKL